MNKSKSYTIVVNIQRGRRKRTGKEHKKRGENKHMHKGKRTTHVHVEQAVATSILPRPLQDNVVEVRQFWLKAMLQLRLFNGIRFFAPTPCRIQLPSSHNTSKIRITFSKKHRLAPYRHDSHEKSQDHDSLVAAGSSPKQAINLLLQDTTPWPV